MSWTEIQGEVAKIKIHSSGKITWNPACHGMLDYPTYVSLFYNAGDNCLGIKECSEVNGGLSFCPVVYTEGHEFEIDASEQLGSIGVSVETLYTATPFAPALTDDDEIQMTDIENLHVWFYLPE